MNRIRPFTVAALPQLQVGVDALEALPLWLAASHHLEVILCIGGSSFARAGHLDALLGQCTRLHITLSWSISPENPALRSLTGSLNGTFRVPAPVSSGSVAAASSTLRKLSQR